MAEVITLRTILAPSGQRVTQLVGEWPDTALVTMELLESARPECIQVDGDEVRIVVDNASATYFITGKDPLGNAVISKRSSMRDPINS